MQSRKTTFFTEFIILHLLLIFLEQEERSMFPPSESEEDDDDDEQTTSPTVAVETTFETATDKTVSPRLEIDENLVVDSMAQLAINHATPEKSEVLRTPEVRSNASVITAPTESKTPSRIALECVTPKSSTREKDICFSPVQCKVSRL